MARTRSGNQAVRPHPAGKLLKQLRFLIRVAADQNHPFIVSQPYRRRGAITGGKGRDRLRIAVSKAKIENGQGQIDRRTPAISLSRCRTDIAAYIRCPQGQHRHRRHALLVAHTY